jgi:hypothetical protein
MNRLVTYKKPVPDMKNVAALNMQALKCVSVFVDARSTLGTDHLMPSLLMIGPPKAVMIHVHA